MMMYVDDLILMNEANDVINDEIATLKKMLDVDNMGMTKDYSGVSVCKKNGITTLTQQQLINETHRDGGNGENVKSLPILAMPTKILY